MRDINRRINTVEKQLSLGQHEKQIRLLQFIISNEPTNSTGKDIEKLGPIETWITYQEQLQAEENAPVELKKNNPGCLGAVITIDLDVDKEYQARSTKSNQKQPKSEKLSLQNE